MTKTSTWDPTVGTGVALSSLTSTASLLNCGKGLCFPDSALNNVPEMSRILKDSRSQVENQGSVWQFERIMELWRQPIWSHDTDHLALWSQRCVCLSAFFSLGKSLFSLVCRRSDPDPVMFSLFNMWESFKRRAQVLWLTMQPLCPSPKDSRDSQLTSSPGSEPFKNDSFRSLRLHTFFIRLIRNYF